MGPQSVDSSGAQGIGKHDFRLSGALVTWPENGWTFQPGDGVVPDTVIGADYLYQVYTAAKSDYSGRVTVPVLWDKKTKTIVSNESPEIIRMLNTSFDDIGAKPGGLLPRTIAGAN